MLFADDVILLSDTIIGLQRQLSILEYFCDDYHVEVNTVKTKVLVFRNGGNLARREKWTYKGTNIEVVNGFHYVGLLFTTQMSLNCMVSDIALKGKPEDQWSCRRSPSWPNKHKNWIIYGKEMTLTFNTHIPS